MSVLNLTLVANSFVYPQVTLIIILILLGILATCISIYLDFRRVSRERTQGMQVAWYKRSMTVLNIALPFLNLLVIFDVLSITNIFPYSPFNILIVIVLAGIFLSLIVYSLHLRKQKQS